MVTGDVALGEIDAVTGVAGDDVALVGSRAADGVVREGAAAAADDEHAAPGVGDGSRADGVGPDVVVLQNDSINERSGVAPDLHTALTVARNDVADHRQRAV